MNWPNLLYKPFGTSVQRWISLSMYEILFNTHPVSTHCFLTCRVPLLQALIQLFELPEDYSVPDDEHFIEIEDTPGYQTAYSQLAFAGKHESDPFQGAVPNAKVLLAQSLHKLSTAHPGQVSNVCLFLCLSDLILKVSY